MHEKLYKTRDLTHIYFPEYCRDLVGHLVETLRPAPHHDDNRLTAVIEVDDIHLDIDTIIPLGLIINELVTNAVTHGFPAPLEDMPGEARERPAEIRIGMHCDKSGTCCLTVTNNGKDLPGDFDWNHSQTLGMFIVRSLAEQLNGTMEVRQTRQTEFILRFQMEQTSKCTGKEEEENEPVLY